MNETSICPHCEGVNGQHFSELSDIHYFMKYQVIFVNSLHQLLKQSPKFLNHAFKQGYQRAIKDMLKSINTPPSS